MRKLENVAHRKRKLRNILKEGGQRMQDFTTYNYNITLEQLKEAQKLVKDITVIINGEYYTLIEEAPENVNITHHFKVWD